MINGVTPTGFEGTNPLDTYQVIARKLSRSRWAAQKCPRGPFASRWRALDPCPQRFWSWAACSSVGRLPVIAHAGAQNVLSQDVWEIPRMWPCVSLAFHNRLPLHNRRAVHNLFALTGGIMMWQIRPTQMFKCNVQTWTCNVRIVARRGFEGTLPSWTEYEVLSNFAR